MNILEWVSMITALDIDTLKSIGYGVGVIATGAFGVIFGKKDADKIRESVDVGLIEILQEERTKAKGEVHQLKEIIQRKIEGEELQADEIVKLRASLRKLKLHIRLLKSVVKQLKKES